jgi:hypothetical protein
VGSRAKSGCGIEGRLIKSLCGAPRGGAQPNPTLHPHLNPMKTFLPTFSRKSAAAIIVLLLVISATTSLSAAIAAATSDLVVSLTLNPKLTYKFNQPAVNGSSDGYGSHDEQYYEGSSYSGLTWTESFYAESIAFWPPVSFSTVVDQLTAGTIATVSNTTDENQRFRTTVALNLFADLAADAPGESAYATWGYKISVSSTDTKIPPLVLLATRDSLAANWLEQPYASQPVNLEYMWEFLLVPGEEYTFVNNVSILAVGARAVPEPATWAWISGFGLCVVLHQLRRRRPAPPSITKHSCR